MSEKGVVVNLQGDQAIIEMEASKDCEACGACSYSREGRMVTPVTNTLKAKVGDSIEIEIESQVVIVAAAIVYILPIVFFFAGYALGLWIGRLLEFDTDLLGISGGALFLILSYGAVRSLDKRARLSRRYEPRMINTF